MSGEEKDNENYEAAKNMSGELYRAAEKNFDLANETGSKLSAQLFTLAVLVITVVFGLVQADKLHIDWLVLLCVITSLGSIVCGINRMAIDTNFLIKAGRKKYKGSSNIVKQYVEGKDRVEFVKTFEEHMGSGDTDKRANDYFKWQKRLFILSMVIIVLILLEN